MKLPCLILLIVVTLYSQIVVGSTDHGTLCPGVTRTVSTTVRHGFKQIPQNYELFTFEGLAGQVISIVVNRTAAPMDPVMVLWSPTGSILAIRDDDVRVHLLKVTTG